MSDWTKTLLLDNSFIILKYNVFSDRALCTKLHKGEHKDRRSFQTIFWMTMMIRLWFFFLFSSWIKNEFEKYKYKHYIYITIHVILATFAEFTLASFFQHTFWCIWICDETLSSVSTSFSNKSVVWEKIEISINPCWVTYFFTFNNWESMLCNYLLSLSLIFLA